MLYFLPFVIESLNLLAFPELYFLLDLHVTCCYALQEKKSYTKYKEIKWIVTGSNNTNFWNWKQTILLWKEALSMDVYNFYFWDIWKPSLTCGSICLYFFNYKNIILLIFYKWYFFCYGIKWQIGWTAGALK